MKLVLIIKNIFLNKNDWRNHHHVFIEASEDIVTPQVFLWGEASWWPKACGIRFFKTSAAPLEVGTRLEFQVIKPFRMKSWDVEVSRMIPNQEIERTFRSGMFVGKEWLTIEPRLNGTRVDYILQYRIRSKGMALLWFLFLRKIHDKNIELIFSALKEYALKEQKKREYP